jgi:hypothetical protein
MARDRNALFAQASEEEFSIAVGEKPQLRGERRICEEGAWF